jgi:hypothetical protein
MIPSKYLSYRLRETPLFILQISTEHLLSMKDCSRGEDCSSLHEGRRER